MSEKTIKNTGNTKPIRMWIDGKCFNLKPLKFLKKRGSKASTSASDNSEDDISSVNSELNIDNINYDIDDNGTMSLSFELPPLYYLKLHLNDCFDLNSIRKETNTTISIPQADKPGKIMIKGENETDLKKALHELHSVIGLIRNRAMVLQFTSIPLLSDEIKSNFEKFKSEILKHKNTRGLDESIFISALKLHLTIDVFVLLNNREKTEAKEALEEYNTTVLKPLIEKSGPLKIQVAGIECMNEEYEKVDVLYAKAKIINETEEVSLQKIANSMSLFFYEKGLLKKHQENVKLHMTLINTKYRKSPGSPKKRWTKRISLDAREIMEKYKDYEFGTCDLKNIHISNISSIGKNGFYDNLTTIEV